MKEKSNTATLEPGIHEDIPFDEYCKLPYMNSSVMKYGFVSMSMLHCAATGELDRTSSDAQRFGRGMHTLILEGDDKFNAEHQISSPCCATLQSGAKAGQDCGIKSSWTNGQDDWYCGKHADKDICHQPEDHVSMDEYHRIKKAAERIRNHKCVAVLKRPGWSELTIIWDEFGMRFKARLDRASLNISKPLIVDLKKMDNGDLTHERAEKAITDYRYYFQASMYSRGAEILTGQRVDFMWIFAKSKDDFDVLPVRLTNSMREHGNLWFGEIARRYTECLERGVFPGVHDRDEPASLMLRKWEQELTPERVYLED